MKKTKLVHVVFKSHLDIGFTDLAANVTENYLVKLIPAAMKTAEELRNRGGPERFVWTTGSWLIHTCLKLCIGKLRCDICRREYSHGQHRKQAGYRDNRQNMCR